MTFTQPERGTKSVRLWTSIALLCGDLDEYVDAMVQQVNETEVSTEDCLSDHVQHYDSKEAVIENARETRIPS